MLNTRLAGGEVIRLRQRTKYPWDGTVHITLEEAPKKEFSLFLRIPGWAETARVSINGRVLRDKPEPGQYFEIRRLWSVGDQARLVLPMTVQLLEAHPLVDETRNQAAVRRGPIIYCLESTDLPDNIRVINVAVSPKAGYQDHFVKDLLGGVTVVETKAYVRDRNDWGNTLYRRISPKEPKSINIRLIPYYAWGNRGDSEMTVWIPLR